MLCCMMAEPSSKAGDVCWCLWSGFLLYEDVAMHGDSASSNGLVVRGAAKHSQDQGLLSMSCQCHKEVTCSAVSTIFDSLYVIH